MRIINIITHDTEDGIRSIESFAIVDEQLSDDVVKQAEKFFWKKLTELHNHITEEIFEDALEDGYFEINGRWVSFVWSDVENV